MPGKRHDIHERAFVFGCEVVRLYLTLCKQDHLWQPLAVQFLEAGTGIGANLEEADAGQSKADFIAKCCIARKEAFETRFWLRVFSACSIGPQQEVQLLPNEAREFVAILTAIVRNARRSPNRG